MSRVRKHRERNKRMFNRKKAEFLDDMLRSLDLMIYAELSTVYYMDCSFLRMVLRAIVQFFYLTPKPAIFPEPPQNRPYPVGLILGTNVFCALLHLWATRPDAGEATRGYLHGGLLLDFIGQRGPSSKFHMVVLDALVLSLQLVMLCAFIERQSLKRALSTTAGSNATTAQRDSSSTASLIQDHDHEERGLLRSAPQESEDIELRPLDATGAAIRTNSEEVGEADERLTSNRSTHRTDAHIFDAFNSGQMIVADLHLWDTVRSQYAASMSRNREADPAYSTFSANLPGNRWFGFRMRIGGRNLAQDGNE
ncbi:MAG: hypothetical protein Q9165_006035 [Trypethelium subeluteriae]